jgi:hypothetical protein
VNLYCSIAHAQSLTSHFRNGITASPASETLKNIRKGAAIAMES